LCIPDDIPVPAFGECVQVPPMATTFQVRCCRNPGIAFEKLFYKPSLLILVTQSEQKIISLPLHLVLWQYVSTFLTP